MTMTSIDAQHREHLLVQAYREFSEGHVGGLLNLVHTDVEWTGAHGGSQPSGQLALRDYWLEQFRHADPRVVPVRFTHDGDAVTVEALQLVRALDGTPMQEALVRHRYEFRGNRVSRVEVLQDGVGARRDESPLADVWAAAARNASDGVGGETVVIVETTVVAITPE